MATTFGSLKATGTTMLVGVATLLAGISGTLIFSDQAPEVTGTGSDGATQVVYLQQARTALVATGATTANAYNVANYPNPLAATGAIQEVCLEVVTATPHVANFYVDCGIVHDNATTGTGQTIFNAEDLTVGLHCIVPSTTEIIFGPTERIKCATRSGTGAGLSGDMFVRFRETIIP